MGRFGTPLGKYGCITLLRSYTIIQLGLQRMQAEKFTEQTLKKADSVRAINMFHIQLLLAPSYACIKLFKEWLCVCVPASAVRSGVHVGDDCAYRYVVQDTITSCTILRRSLIQ